MMNPPRGTKDSYSSETWPQRWLIEKLEKMAINFGFQELKTPHLEYSQIFHNCDTKELFECGKYTFRPEGTAGIVRSILTKKLLNTQPNPLKIFYVGSMFRHERPQRGRYREFVQFGFELVNSSNLVDDVEILALSHQINKTFNLSLKLRINYLVKSDLKQQWKEELIQYFLENKSSLSIKAQGKIMTNPMRILDDNEENNRDIIKSAPTLKKHIDQKHLDFIEQNLNALGIDFEWDPLLVRGLDYYTGLVFEWERDGLSVMAGGRYDELFENMSDNKVASPAIGFAIGVERMLQYISPPPQPKQIIYLSSLIGYSAELLLLICELRQQFTIVTNWNISKLKNHYQYAKRIGATLQLVFGPDEQQGNFITFIDQNNHKTTIPLNAQNISAAIELCVT